MVLFVGGLYLSTLDKGLYFSIGTSMMAAGIAGWILLLYVYWDREGTEWVQRVEHVGFVNAFDRRSTPIRPEYEERLKVAKSTIDIMGFGLSNLQEDFRSEFKFWKERATVRILLIDPFFPEYSYADPFTSGQPQTYRQTFAEQRSFEEGNRLDQIKNEVKDFVRVVQEEGLLDETKRFHVRLYRCMPSVNYFRIDEEAFWGPYFVQQPSKNTPTFIVSSRGDLFPLLAKHFDTIWGSDDLSREIPLKWPD